MKQNELREKANCVYCKKPFGAAGIPTFIQIKLQSFGVDIAAIKRQDGLAASMGGHNLLADVMGPNEDLANPVGKEVDGIVCFDCVENLPTGMILRMEE